MVLKLFERIHFYKYKRKCLELFKCARSYSVKGSNLKVLFFGTDNFSLPSIKALHNSSPNVAELSVVTSFKSPVNCVKRYADAHTLRTYKWPIGEDTCRQYDLGVVVSFGHMIPEDIIRAFPMGMINVHASMLPRWRGAAPIIHSIMNGDRTTGVSIMRIEPNKFDIGDIFAQKEVEISPHVLMPELHNILSEEGAQLLNAVLREYPNSFSNPRKQNNKEATYASKILPEITKVKWKSMTAIDLYNLYRALFGYKQLYTTWGNLKIKLVELRVGPITMNEDNYPGSFDIGCHGEHLRVKCSGDQTIDITKVKVEGKRIMTTKEFINGYLKNWKKEDLVFN